MPKKEACDDSGYHVNSVVVAASEDEVHARNDGSQHDGHGRPHEDVAEKGTPNAFHIVTHDENRPERRGDVSREDEVSAALLQLEIVKRRALKDLRERGWLVEHFHLQMAPGTRAESKLLSSRTARTGIHF